MGLARVLVVDDDPDILKIADTILSLVGYEVVTANDAVEAMDRLNSSPFDLLLSDANMPQFSGFELIQTLRNNKRFKDMAIAMLTGLREKKDIERAIRAGVDGYIVKPIEPNLLVEKIEKIFEKRPPLDRTKLEIPQSSSLAAAEIVAPVQLVSISESGITIRSGHEYPKGALIEMSTPLFRSMGLQNSPALKVLSSKMWGENEWEISLGFYGANESLLKGIRKWIEQTHSSGKLAA